MQKPNTVKQIEKTCGVSLKRVPEEALRKKESWGGLRAYCVNDTNQVTGLSLDYMPEVYFTLEEILPELSQLKVISLQNSLNNDLVPNLQANPRLEIVDLSYNTEISDYAFLQALPSLQELDLSYNDLQTVGPFLGSCTGLGRLNLKGNPVKDLPTLGSLPQLSDLDISSNPLIRDLNFLKDLEQLKSLYCNHNSLVDLSPLQNLTQLTTLELNKCNIIDFSPISLLKALKSLSLNSNNLYDHSFLKFLQNLKKLQLDTNRLPDLNFVLDLPRLQQLSIGSNREIRDWKLISRIKDLKRLSLTNNELTNLNFLNAATQLQHLNLGGIKNITNFSFLSQFTDLRELSLWNTGIGNCGFLKNLDKLEELDLWNNNLVDILPVQYLPQLVYLNLSQNNISNAFVIKDLPRLNYLNLSKNLLNDMPPLAELDELTYLNLAGNNLRNIHFLKDSTQLVSLKLDNNYLSDLTPLKEFRGLAHLTFASNHIQDASFLRNLESLNSLKLDDNPITFPPQEIATKGLKDLKMFFAQEAQQGTEKLFEARVLFVGEPGAGKTSLMKKLVDPTYRVPQPDQPSTVGINIKKGWSFNCSDSPTGAFKANLWDFGGQEVQYHLHQFFLSSRALYVLLVDDRRQATNYDYWFDIIGLLGEGSPVLVVLNEINHRSISNFDYKKYKFQFQSQFEIEKREVDLSENNPNFRLEEIRNKVQQMLIGLEHIGDELPASWIPIREAIEKEAKKNHHINFTSFKKICERFELYEEAYQLQLAGYLHDLGIMLHFQQDNSLFDFIILDPEWAVRAVYNILSDTEVYKNNGKFTKKWLFDRWGKQYSYQEKNKLLNLMEKDKFDLIYPIKGNAEEYLAPYLLAETDPVINWDQSNNLRFRYQYKFMPKGLIARLIVRLNEDIYNDQGKPMIWKKGAVFEYSDTKAKVMETRSKEGLNVIDISINTESGAPKELLALIRREIRILNRNMKKDMVEELIPCNCEICTELGEPNFYALEHLEAHMEGGYLQVFCSNLKKQVSIQSLIEGIVNETRLQTEHPQAYHDNHRSDLQGDDTEFNSDNDKLISLYIQSMDSFKHMLEEAAAQEETITGSRAKKGFWQAFSTTFKGYFSKSPPKQGFLQKDLDRWRDQIAMDEADQVLIEIRQANKAHPERLRSLTVLSSWHRQLKRQSNMNTLNFEDLGREQRRINNSILDIIDEMESDLIIRK